jgi:hypothetical protein
VKIQKLLRQFGEHGNDYSPVEMGDKINEIIHAIAVAGVIEYDKDDVEIVRKELQPILEPKKEELGVPPTRSYAVRSSSTADKVYLVKDGKRYWIKNPETLRKLGFNFHTIKNITNEEMNKIEVGEPMDLKEKKPLEVLKPKDEFDKYNL